MNKLQVHENLCRLDCSFERNIQKNFNPEILKKYCPFSEVLDEETIDSMRKDLVQDIEILKQQFSNKYFFSLKLK